MKKNIFHHQFKLSRWRLLASWQEVMEKVPEEVPEVEFRKKNGIVWDQALALMTQTIQVRECNITLLILT